MPVGGSTADAILDIAQRLLQTRGYNGFSFRDIAEALGIRSASIHYHFPTKSHLGIRLAQRYRARFAAELDTILAEESDPGARLLRFSGLFRQTFEIESRLCLCGMLSAEIATLPEAVAVEVQGFFRDTADWLAVVLGEGRAAGSFSFPGPPADQARLLLAILEGAMVVARGLRSSGHFDTIARSCLVQVGHGQAAVAPASTGA